MLHIYFNYPYWPPTCGRLFHLNYLNYFSLFRRLPLADLHDAKHTTRSMHLDLTKGRLLTCGGDRIVKVNNKLWMISKPWLLMFSKHKILVALKYTFHFSYC